MSSRRERVRNQFRLSESRAEFLEEFGSFVGSPLFLTRGDQEPAVYQQFQILGSHLNGYLGDTPICRIPNPQTGCCVGKRKNGSLRQLTLLYCHLERIPSLLYFAGSSQYRSGLPEMRRQARCAERAPCVGPHKT